MTLEQFREELRLLDPRLTIDLNPNRQGLANIKLGGFDVCPIPSGEIKEEPDPGYTITAPNGWQMKHKSRPEALAIVMDTLEKIKTPEGYANFFDR